MAEIIYFLAPVMSFGLIIVGVQYNDKISATIGGMLMFLFGVAVLITPIVGISDLLNLVIAMIAFGYGGYMMLAPNVEDIRAMLS